MPLFFTIKILQYMILQMYEFETENKGVLKLSNIFALVFVIAEIHFVANTIYYSMYNIL